MPRTRNMSLVTLIFKIESFFVKLETIDFELLQNFTIDVFLGDIASFTKHLQAGFKKPPRWFYANIYVLEILMLKMLTKMYGITMYTLSINKLLIG